MIQKNNNIKPKIKLSMSTLYKIIQNALQNGVDLMNKPDITDTDKQSITQILNSGHELLAHIKSYVKNDVSMLFMSGKKSKIKNKKKIMGIFTQKSTMIIAGITAIQINLINRQVKAEAA